jgi:hypothetical protein
LHILSGNYRTISRDSLERELIDSVDLPVDREVGCVDFDSILCFEQRTDRTLAVTLVSLGKLFCEVYERQVSAKLFEFELTPMGPDGGVCYKKHLEFCVRENYCSDVASFEHDGSIFPYSALLFDKFRADLGIRR